MANVKQTHKIEFGQFLASARAAAGLTQRGLASEVFVTESAVSKWERGLSYPDLATLSPLARALGVSEQELVTASEDHRGRQDARTAALHRRWRSALIWTTLGIYAVTLLTTAIVNVSVDHTLSWFWIVGSAVLLAFSVTTLPMLLTARRGWSTLVAAVVSLGLLLASIPSLAGSTAFAVVAVSVLVGVVVIWGPLAVRSFGTPGMRRHGAVLCILVDGVALLVLLAVVLGAAGHAEAFMRLALPLTIAGVAVALVLTVIVRYLPVAGLVRAALACLVGAGVVFFAGPFVDTLLASKPFAVPAVQLATWTDATVNGNVSVLTALAFIAAAVVLTVVAMVFARGRVSAEAL